MCIQSSCTIVYNLALDRGRRSLHGEIEICLSLPSPYGEGNTNKIIPFFVGTGVLDSPLFVNIGRTLFVQKIKIMNTLKTAVGGFSRPTCFYIREKANNFLIAKRFFLKTPFRKFFGARPFLSRKGRTRPPRPYLPTLNRFLQRGQITVCLPLALGRRSTALQWGHFL